MHKNKQNEKGVWISKGTILYNFCYASFDKWVIILVVFIDITMSILCLFLFCKPLILLIQSMNALNDDSYLNFNTQTLLQNQNNNNTDNQMTNLVIKYTTLTFVAIISSFIGYSKIHIHPLFLCVFFSKKKAIISCFFFGFFFFFFFVRNF